jgi:hypothetical protein
MAPDFPKVKAKVQRGKVIWGCGLVAIRMKLHCLPNSILYLKLSGGLSVIWPQLIIHMTSNFQSDAKFKTLMCTYFC